MASRAAVKDDLLEAAQTIVKALQPLAADMQQRVLTSALALLGIEQRDVSSVGHRPSDAARPAVASPSSRPVSPVELIQQKKPATNAQRIAIFAYYRDKSEGQARFARGELKPYFARAKLVPPQNYDRDFNQAVKLGYIYEDDNESYLTSRGVEAVEAGFEGRTEPKGPAKGKKKPKITRKAKR
jgi:hypothetical protein